MTQLRELSFGYFTDKLKDLQPLLVPLVGLVLLTAAFVWQPRDGGDEERQPTAGTAGPTQQQDPGQAAPTESGDAPDRGSSTAAVPAGETAGSGEGAAPADDGPPTFQRAGRSDRDTGSSPPPGFSPGGGGGQGGGERELRCAADDDLPEPVVGPAVEELQGAEETIEEERGEPLPAPASDTLMQEADCRYEMAQALPGLFALSQVVPADNPLMVAAAAPAVTPACSFAGHFAAVGELFGSLHPVLADSIELCAAVRALGEGGPDVDTQTGLDGPPDTDGPTGSGELEAPQP